MIRMGGRQIDGTVDRQTIRWNSLSAVIRATNRNRVAHSSNACDDSSTVHSPAVRRAFSIGGADTPRCTPCVASLRTPFAWGYWRAPAFAGSESARLKLQPAQTPTGSDSNRLGIRPAQTPTGSDSNRLGIRPAQTPTGSDSNLLRLQPAQTPPFSNYSGLGLRRARTPAGSGCDEPAGQCSGIKSTRCLRHPAPDVRFGHQSRFLLDWAVWTRGRLRKRVPVD